MSTRQRILDALAAAINPTKSEFHDRPLWAVYGSVSYPKIICCRVKPGHRGAPTIWGYSIYQNSGGFRTLGVEVTEWAKENDASIFADQDAALAFLKVLTTPSPKALG